MSRASRLASLAPRARVARRRATRAMAGPPTPARPLGRVARGDASARVRIDAWLDFACPFSGRFWRNCTRAWASYDGKRDVALWVYNQAQPWHAQSALAHEVSLGVERLGGEDAFVAFCETAFSEEHWDEFTDVFVEKMTKGEMYDLYVDVAREAMTGTMGADAASATAGELRKLLELDADALARGEKNPGNAMTQQLKFYVKLGRQTGVHVSPSTYVNGLFADTSSGWSESEWHAFFDAARGK
jgi:protein-disulfide isomerase